MRLTRTTSLACPASELSVPQLDRLLLSVRTCLRRSDNCAVGSNRAITWPTAGKMRSKPCHANGKTDGERCIDMPTTNVPHLDASILKSGDNEASIMAVRASCHGHARRLLQRWLQHGLLGQFLGIPYPNTAIFGT